MSSRSQSRRPHEWRPEWRGTKRLDNVLSEVAASAGGFQAADNLSRDELYERGAFR